MRIIGGLYRGKKLLSPRSQLVCELFKQYK